MHVRDLKRWPAHASAAYKGWGKEPSAEQAIGKKVGAYLERLDHLLM